jgi:hypothetical protein
MKARDPFQNVYSEIANDMVLAREKLTALDRENIRKVGEPALRAGPCTRRHGRHDGQDKNGVTQVVRMPADSDPTLGRIEKIRERDTAVVDTVNDYYASFHDTMEDSYGSWRRPASPSSRRKCARAPRRAPARCSVPRRCSPASFAPNSCSTYDSCRIADAAR